MNCNFHSGWLLILALALGLAPEAPAHYPVAPSLAGAWERSTVVDGDPVTQVLLFAGDYFSWTEYRSADGDFHFTKGGHWSADGGQLVFTYEFHTAGAAQVGAEALLSFELDRQKLRLVLPGGASTEWSRLDSGTTTPLSGAWLFAGRRRDGELQRRSTDGPRKTMKLLTGNRFQWIAYNTATKQFFGTGGGTYTADDGRYVETIGFFSRDKSRVGAVLSFDFEVQDGEWHHSGFSSQGDPMYELWAPRKESRH